MRRKQSSTKPSPSTQLTARCATLLFPMISRTALVSMLERLDPRTEVLTELLGLDDGSSRERVVALAVLAVDDAGATRMGQVRTPTQDSRDDSPPAAEAK